MDHHYFEYFLEIPFADFETEKTKIDIVRSLTLDDKRELFKLMNEDPIYFNYTPKHFIEDREICDFVLSRMSNVERKIFLEHRSAELHGKLQSEMSAEHHSKKNAAVVKI